MKQIFQNFNDIINTLCIVSKSKRIKPKTNSHPRKSFKCNSVQNFNTSPDQTKESKSNDVKGESSHNKMYMCKLCQRGGKAKVLNLYTRSAGIGHNSDTCFDKNNKLSLIVSSVKNIFT